MNIRLPVSKDNLLALLSASFNSSLSKEKTVAFAVEDISSIAGHEERLIDS